MLDNLCSKAPRAYADEILKSLFETGATIRLMRRGRKVTGELEMALPAFGDREARSFTYTSEPITALRLSGRPSIFAGQWHKAAPGESHFYFDEFAIESISQ